MPLLPDLPEQPSRGLAAKLDRISPTRRPTGRPSGWQRWRELLFVHYTFPLELLRPLVPAELELDPWDDLGWVGVVPFRMEGIRPAWLPVGLDFLETNVRTYVHYRGEPGIFFFSLEASSWLAVQAARRGWGLPYFHARMSSERQGRHIDFRTERRSKSSTVNGRAHYEFEIRGEPAAAMEGTLDHFLLERYLLFTVTEGRVSKGHVHHTPYPAAQARLLTSTDTLVEAAGLPPVRMPAAVHYAEGVDVEVFGPFPA